MKIQRHHLLEWNKSPDTYSTLLQLRKHVETEKLERTKLKQLVRRLQRDFALLQPQIESLDRPPTSKSSLVTLEKKLRF